MSHVVLEVVVLGAAPPAHPVDPAPRHTPHSNQDPGHQTPHTSLQSPRRHGSVGRARAARDRVLSRSPTLRPTVRVCECWKPRGLGLASLSFQHSARNPQNFLRAATAYAAQRESSGQFPIDSQFLCSIPSAEFPKRKGWFLRHTKSKTHNLTVCVHPTPPARR